MARFWIRVNAKLANDPEVIAFALAILPKQPVWLAVRATCGLLCALWGTVVDEQEDGNVSTTRNDDVLELWAGWGGKRGVFATEFRARFVDADGTIREWSDYQGKLIERREHDRDRKRRQKAANTPLEPVNDSAGIPQEVGGSSSRNGNGNDQAFALAPTEQESKSPVPDGGFAHVGAAAPAGGGDYQATPEAQEQLRKRGHRPDPDAPRLSPRAVGEVSSEAKGWTDQFLKARGEYCDRWLGENPDEAEEFERLAKAERCLAPGVELGPLAKISVRGIVHRLVSERLNLPGEAAWVAKEKAKALSEAAA